MYKRLSDSQYNAIHDAYIACEPVAAICKTFNVSWDTVYQIVRSFGTSPRHITIRKLSWHQRQQIIADYLSGDNTHKLALHYKVSVPAICYILKRGSIERRPSAFVKLYHHNERAFDKLSKVAAYWLGFLMADGYVRDGHPPSLELHLTLRDVNHLWKFRRFLKAGHKISRYHRSCRFQIRSRRLVERLKYWGLGFNGYRNPHPKLIMSRDFWRGYLDGDGCLSIGKSKYGTAIPSLSLAGPEKILCQFVIFVRKFIQTTRQPSKIRRANAWQISFEYRQARILVPELYRPGDVMLARKYKIAKRIIKMAEIFT